MTYTQGPGSDLGERLLQAYETLLERTKTTLGESKEKGEAALQKALDTSTKKALELRELSFDEAEKVLAFVARDLHDAGSFVASRERELVDWLRLDGLLVEKQAVSKLSGLVDRARLELKHLSHVASKYTQWNTGEVTGMGTLVCTHCGKALQFNKVGRIPPCPVCNGTAFKRGQ